MTSYLSAIHLGDHHSGFAADVFASRRRLHIFSFVGIAAATASYIVLPGEWRSNRLCALSNAALESIPGGQANNILANVVQKEYRKAKQQLQTKPLTTKVM